MNRILTLPLLLVLLSGCSSMPVGNPAVPSPAKAVDLKAYGGTWYEYARYDNRFENGCEGVTAEYQGLDDGQVQVRNTCHKGGPGGPVKVSVGKAKPVSDSGGAKLKVSFFGPFYFGDYWVLDHADDYSWSVVGEPSGKYLWLLTREAVPSERIRSEVEGRAKALGYNLILLHHTEH